LRRLDNYVARLMQYDDSIKTPDKSCQLSEVDYNWEQMKEVQANAEPLCGSLGVTIGIMFMMSSTAA